MAVITSSNPITIPRAKGRAFDALELSSGGLVASCGTIEGVAVGVGVSVGARPVQDVVNNGCVYVCTHYCDNVTTYVAIGHVYNV